MSVRNLDKLFKPQSVALVGASQRPNAIGAVVARNLLRDGFAGPVLPVNPHARAIQGVLAYPSVDALPLVPDLAVIATPPAAVLETVATLGARGCKAAVIMTAGLGAARLDDGRLLVQAVLDTARPHLMRIVGPNCLGITVPGIGLDATFAHVPARRGDIALLTQSGAMATAMLDWAEARRIGFSHVVSLGDMADVDFGDLLDYLGADTEVRAILLYVEGIAHARKFMSAARAAARAKPVIVVKSGRFPASAEAARSHTGALAGADAVYDAAFRRAGMLRVPDLESLFAAAETLARARPVRGDRLAILTNGGGMGVMATDALIAAGGRLAELAPATRQALDAVLPAIWSHGDPIDIIGDAPGARYGQALGALLGDPGVDAVLVMNCPTAVASATEAADATIAALAGRPDRRPTVLTAWVGEHAARIARDRLAQAGLPAYATPEEAVAGFMHLVRFRRGQEQLLQVPRSAPPAQAPERDAAEALIDRTLDSGQDWLDEVAAKELLKAYGVPVVETRRADSPEAVERAAGEIGGRLALKILSPDILHKSDVGGVVLDLATPAAAAEAARHMRGRVLARLPEARIEGWSVQRMASSPGAFELIAGVTVDPIFGPVVLFGHGGVGVAAIGDTALALAPLNLELAHELIGRTRVWRQLQGYRGRPPVDLDAVAGVLVQLSRLATDLGRVAELDINPLLADDAGVVALDARIRVTRSRNTPPSILPYPSDKERRVTLRDGSLVFLRPIQPEDAALYPESIARTDPVDLRMRFFGSLRELPPALVARLTQIDYDRELALIALPPPEDDPAPTAFLGVGRVTADPDNVAAEFALFVRTDWKGRGLGTALMTAIIDHARQRGIQTLWGTILRENEPMLDIVRHMGLSVEPDPQDPTQMIARLEI